MEYETSDVRLGNGWDTWIYGFVGYCKGKYCCWGYKTEIGW